MPWPRTGATQCHAQLGLPDKGRPIKGLVVCNNLSAIKYHLKTIKDDIKSKKWKQIKSNIKKEVINYCFQL